MNTIVKAIIALVAIVYVISPVDFIPDIAPVVGWADDLVVAITALWLVFKR